MEEIKETKDIETPKDETPKTVPEKEAAPKAETGIPLRIVTDEKELARLEYAERNFPKLQTRVESLERELAIRDAVLRYNLEEEDLRFVKGTTKEEIMESAEALRQKYDKISQTVGTDTEERVKKEFPSPTPNRTAVEGGSLEDRRQAYEKAIK